MLRLKLTSIFLLSAFLLPVAAIGQTASPAVKNYSAPKEAVDKIKNEGMNHSQSLQILSYLSDVIGARLTGSPAMKRANEWTRDQMMKWGMQNAHLEAWGPFGRGWTLKSFDAQIVAPYDIPLIAYPKAWSPSTNGTITGDVVYFDVKSEADLAKYKGQLRGKIILVSPSRAMKANFTAMGRRLTDEDLAKLAAAPDPSAEQSGAGIPPEMLKMYMARFVSSAKQLDFLRQEGAAVLVDNSSNGSGGTVFVSQASVGQQLAENITVEQLAKGLLQPWQKESETKMIPQMTMATEHYNRLLRMIQAGEKLRMTVNIQAEYNDNDPMAYNTVAEIPGTDPKLKDEIVMLGGHMDSWHAGTGATDNGAGVAVAMEAARIIQTLGLKPRRTIRVALWSGEEEGLFGSRAYVKEHFGEMRNASPTAAFGMGGDLGTLLKKADYEKLSAYYNLDNGTGKIRGIYLQGNSAARPIFEQWLAQFADAGAKTLTFSNAESTDHLSFDTIGLPGFQFIQDEIEYNARTHHSNQDVFDRIQPDDLKQAATIMAAFVYQTAMMDERMPRKPMK